MSAGTLVIPEVGSPEFAQICRDARRTAGRLRARMSNSGERLDPIHAVARYSIRTSDGVKYTIKRLIFPRVIGREAQVQLAQDIYRGIVAREYGFSEEAVFFESLLSEEEFAYGCIDRMNMRFPVRNNSE